MSNTDKTGPIEVQFSRKPMHYIVDNEMQPIIGGINPTKKHRDRANRKARHRVTQLKSIARRLRGDVGDVEIDFAPDPIERRHATRTSPLRINGLRAHRNSRQFAGA